MTATPNLPPLPIPGDPTIVQGFAPDDMRLQVYALAAYQAGRDAGLSEGFDAGFAHSGEGYNSEYPPGLMSEPDYAINKDEALSALKSDANGGE